ncbi:universal stress protein, partial [Cognatishimia sp. 1_MG-2023]|uniref:universal stress protein n=1 Tax=Cognatishimia sp. 1_MG-2023 TaxID=3062642 RepID=UPI0026E26F98
MSEKFVVGFDGSDAAKRALDFAVDRAKALGGSVVVAHVLEWSPYSFLTPTELEERHKRRREELERAETALMKPVVDA